MSEMLGTELQSTVAAALSEADLRDLMTKHAPLIAAFLDTAPSYEVSDFAALATRFITDCPGLIDEVLARSLRIRLCDVPKIGIVSRLFFTWKALDLTAKETADVIPALFREIVVPLSHYASASRH